MKRDWWGGFDRFKAKSDSYADTIDHGDALFVAGMFIQLHAAEAERHGWQPAHLLSEKGLARRWALIPLVPRLIQWGKRTMLFDCDGTPTALKGEADGSVSLITGSEYTAICGRQLPFLNANALPYCGGPSHPA